MKIFRPGVALALLWLLIPFGSIFAQSTDSATTSAELARDSTLKIIRRIPFVGSMEREPTRLITDSTINFHDYRYAGDLLTTVPGVFLLDLGSAGQLHGLTLDGLGPRTFTFMADGISLNDPLTGTFDSYLYPPEHFERMEVITGPRAYLYGIYGSGAAVNFVSRSRKDIHPYSRIRYSEAPYGTGFFDGMFSQDIWRGFNMTGGFSHRTSDGQYPNSNYDGWNGRLKLRYNISPELNLFASEMYNQTQAGLNGGVDLARTIDTLRFERLQTTMVNTDAYEKVTRHDVQLGAAMRLFPDSTAISTLTLFHSSSLREYRDEENREFANGRFVAQDHRSQWYGIRAQHHHDIGSTILDATAELESRGVIASDVAGPRVKTVGTLRGLLTQTFSDELALHAFLRFQHADGVATAEAGGADMTWTVAPGLSFNAGVARSSVAPPIMLERPAADSIPAPVLVDSLNGIAQVGLAYASGSGSSVSVTYVRHVVDYRGISAPPLLDRLIVNALELSLSVRIGWLALRSEARYAQATDDGWDVMGPRWSGSGELCFWDKIAGGHLDLKTGLRVRAFDSYRALTFHQQYREWLPSGDPRIVGSAVIDYILIARIGDAYIHLLWENLLDRKYVTASFFPMGERQLRFGVSWDLLD